MQKIATGIYRLTDQPDKQGKSLGGKLTAFRNIRAVGQRFRIIYKIMNDEVMVLVVALGIRREGVKTDIFALAKKLFRLRLLEPERKPVPSIEEMGRFRRESAPAIMP